MQSLLFLCLQIQRAIKVNNPSRTQGVPLYLGLAGDNLNNN